MTTALEKANHAGYSEGQQIGVVDGVVIGLVFAFVAVASVSYFLQRKALLEVQKNKSQTLPTPSIALVSNEKVMSGGWL